MIAWVQYATGTHEMVHCRKSHLSKAEQAIERAKEVESASRADAGGCHGQKCASVGSERTRTSRAY